ncbi:MAG: hypothetical protein ED556_01420 [Winogradskyella sp.]|uniref:hypothetical protein n=1 Tax=Winogradskyella sp. TaxID=1883156 RepID=UPI000F3D50E1|nr:hypothetical protein [Winogradskyella sp.]RNC87879.1 MAG: hypothetical protein ED556_01420 [Winogradskyella sp.]
MKFHYYKALNFFFFLSIALYSQGQENFKHNSLAEKIYVQLDNEAYATDTTVWFKLILANAGTHNLGITSGVVYVDLINNKEKIIDSKIIKVQAGIGNGFFDLDKEYSQGVYLIRVYTEWNKNFKNDFITEKYFKIFSIENKETSLNKEYLKKNSVNQSSISSNDTKLNFYPESGKMVAGLPSKIGFKITNFIGKGIKGKGEILNSDGNVISFFESNEVGLGHFVIDKVDVNEEYSAKLYGNNEVYNLPNVYQNAFVLSIVERNKYIVATLRTNENSTEKISLSASVRGKDYFNKELNLINGKYIFTIPKTTFPEGVIIFTAFNNLNQPKAERLFFNDRSDDKRLDVNVRLHDSIFKKRDVINLDLSVTKKEDSLIKSSSSILVFNKKSETNILTERDNILSYLLLSSDIKGHIENPGAYFSKNKSLNIDNLMLTQGWRNYKYTDSRKNLNFRMERGLSIRGTVNTKQRKMSVKNLPVTLLTFGNDASIYTGQINAPGSFNFPIEDLYGDYKEMILKPFGISENERKNYTITLSKTKKLKPKFAPNKLMYHNITDSAYQNKINEIRLQNLIKNEYYTNLDGINELDEVVIDAYKMTPKRKKMFEKYGKPDVVIDDKEIMAKKAKNSRGLYSVMMAFQDRVTIFRDSTGRLNASTAKGGKGHTTLVLIDAIPVSQSDYFLIERMIPDEITSFEIIDNPPGFRQLYAQVLNTNVPSGYFPGSIISIYTKSGKGLYGALDIKKDIRLNKIPVFSTKKEFYIPNYSDEISKKFKEPDFRSTIFWKPNVETTSSKPIKLSYSHSDNVGDFVIIIESITDNGQIGYKTLEYKVTESQD